MPRLPRERRVAMTPELARAVLEATKADRYAAAYALALCGLRAGEILGLAWQDVDLEAGSVAVRSSTCRRAGKSARLVQLKTASSEATVALPPLVVTRLEAHRKAQLEERIAAGQPTEDGLVFVTEQGYAVGGPAFTRASSACWRLRDSRRCASTTCATAWPRCSAQAGLHPRLAQEYLRHANQSP